MLGFQLNRLGKYICVVLVHSIIPLNMILYVIYICGKSVDVLLGGDDVCVPAGIKVYLWKGIPKFLSILSPSTDVTTSVVFSA